PLSVAPPVSPEALGGGVSARHPSLLELEQVAAEEARRYGCEQLRQRLQAIVDEQGAICPSSGERLEDARFRPLPLITTLGQITLRARYGFHRCAQRWMFAVQDLWGPQITARTQSAPRTGPGLHGHRMWLV